MYVYTYETSNSIVATHNKHIHLIQGKRPAKLWDMGQIAYISQIHFRQHTPEGLLAKPSKNPIYKQKKSILTSFHVHKLLKAGENTQQLAH